MAPTIDRSLVEFYRKFLQQIDPPNIPNGSILKQPDVQRVLEQRFFNVPAEQISAYQAKILRTVIERIQNAITDAEDEEVSDHLMTLLATLPRSRPEVDLSKTLVSYFPPVPYDDDASNPVQILEAKKIIGSGPNTGLRTWEASLRLAYYLHSHPSLVRGRSVLELGAGTGFLSIFCAAYLSPQRSLVTDGHEDVLSSLRQNIDLNVSLYEASNSGKPKTQKLFWGDQEDLDNVLQTSAPTIPASTDIENIHSKRYDLILGADVTYHPDACLSLASTLSILATHNPTATVLISATQRNLETMEIFLRACQDSDLAAEEVQWEAPPFEKQTGLWHNVVAPIRIWSLRLRNSEIGSWKPNGGVEGRS